MPSPLDKVSIWNEAGSGTKVLRLSVHHPTAQAGVGRVSADAGSAMASLIGTEEATGLGAINRFDFEARVESIAR
ncbi:hypothetical protein CH305_00325 [Rhodococcus sp. 15-649-2-2]|uniref:hypothetical protein n=1 Tax=Rhodococcus sp. 15-649-2-2 TaxID=2023140 RepID=UPI000B9AF782|nr:hypothetical protein [Rhodococcus sp. 15-649-2-2]OZE88323.1 hypothetical protein CH305_00325 [Rhodococcus sp. 15-649-2-2]